MKLADFLSQFTAATGDIKKELSAANATIKDLTTKLAKADADDQSDNADLDKVLEQLREILNEQASDTDESDSDDSDADSDSDSDATSDDNADEDNDETDAKAATKRLKLKALAAKTAKLAVEHKKLKASVPKKVISAIAAMGIPEPVKTKVDGEKPKLTGRARVAAAFTEQLAK